MSPARRPGTAESAPLWRCRTSRGTELALIGDDFSGGTRGHRTRKAKEREAHKKVAECFDTCSIHFVGHLWYRGIPLK